MAASAAEVEVRLQLVVEESVLAVAEALKPLEPGRQESEVWQGLKPVLGFLHWVSILLVSTSMQPLGLDLMRGAC